MSDLNTSVQDALEYSIGETFSEMAFVEAIPAEEPGSVEESQVFTIDVNAEKTHRLVLRLGLASKKAIVENIHGKPWDELHSAEIDDCLLEFLNVLGGSFGKTLWGDTSKYKISFPAVQIEIPEEATGPGSNEYWFDAEGALFSVVVAET
jgi:hypothetical protein